MELRDILEHAEASLQESRTHYDAKDGYVCRENLIDLAMFLKQQLSIDTDVPSESTEPQKE